MILLLAGVRTASSTSTRGGRYCIAAPLLVQPRGNFRSKDARMKRVDPQKRSYYVPTERMAILELRAAQAWSVQQTVETFLVTAATSAAWMRRVDEEGPHALVQVREPVNKFPDFARYAVQRLKALCPNLGKVKLAEMLCRAGLHLGTATVGRILNSPVQNPSNAPLP